VQSRKLASSTLVRWCCQFFATFLDHDRHFAIKFSDTIPEQFSVYSEIRMTTCLENLEMSGNLTAVREMSGILLKVRKKLPKTV